MVFLPDPGKFFVHLGHEPTHAGDKFHFPATSIPHSRQPVAPAGAAHTAVSGCAAHNKSPATPFLRQQFVLLPWAGQFRQGFPVRPPRPGASACERDCGCPRLAIALNGRGAGPGPSLYRRTAGRGAPEGIGKRRSGSGFRALLRLTTGYPCAHKKSNQSAGTRPHWPFAVPDGVASAACSPIVLDSGQPVVDARASAARTR